jgi:hypothetical protein
MLPDLIFEMEWRAHTTYQSRALRLNEGNSYSIFDSALYRNRDAEWLFPQEKATLHDLKTSTCESKML